MSEAKPRLADLRMSSPLQAEICRSPGVYSWWLDTSRFPTPDAAGLTLPDVPRLLHRTGTAELLYVGRARRSLHQRITRQHLRRTRSSALRRTLLAVLLLDDQSWRDGAALDRRGRLVQDADAEGRLTTWMQERLRLGWISRQSVADVDAVEMRWISEHQPAMNTDGTEHGFLLTARKRAFLDGLPSNSNFPAEGPTA